MPTTVWKGQLTFGLVSLPVRLYRAARKQRIRLHYLAPSEHVAVDQAQTHRSEKPERAGLRIVDSPDDEPEFHVASPAPAVSRISQSVVSAENQRAVSRSDLLRGHEVAPDQYVTFTQQELRQIRPETSSTMEIIRSVHLSEIDPVYFETSYYVVPDKGGERAYALLFVALKESGYVALATVAMHGREHVVVIRPGAKGLLAHTIFYENEVRAENQTETRIDDVSPKELQLARTFVEAIAAPFAPEEFKDTRNEKLQAMIAARTVQSQVSLAGSVTKPIPQALDLMEALKKSIEARRPPQPETSTARRGPGKVIEPKSKPRKRSA
jgi:DNA end-binding protein Ku